MANLTVTNWTVAYRNGDRNQDSIIVGKKRYNHLKLSLPSGSTFPLAGLAMPAAGAAGMIRNLDSYSMQNGAMDPTTFTTGVTTSSGAAKMFALNVTGNKLYAYQVEVASGSGLAVIRAGSGDGATKAIILHVTAVGW